MAKKYDTNPLDPDFPEKARAVAAVDDETQTLPYKGGVTRTFADPAETAEKTRKFAPDDVSAYAQGYSQPYNGQYVPANYQGYGLAGQSATHKVAGIGLPENVLTMLAYVPFSIGFIASIIELLIVPRSEPKVRYHAAQALAAHLAIFVIGILIGGVARLFPFTGTAGTIFGVVSTVMLVIFAIKAWQGKPIHIQTVDPLTNWLEEKVAIKQ
ncbi:MAG: DUF4870 domain-containing protein [Acidobacteriota bacterium]